jgi:DNA repair protein RadC
VQSASRQPLEGAEALSTLEGITELYVAKGKKSLFFDLGQQRPSDQELLGLLLGRSGKLRAPTIRIGRRLIVGYNSHLLESTLL